MSTALTPRGESTVNANHARPMLAFWLLAIVAATITGFGLSAGSNEIQVRAGSPSPVSRSNAPDLLLGGLLRAQPTFGSVTSTTGSAAAAEYHARASVVGAAPGGSAPNGGPDPHGGPQGGTTGPPGRGSGQTVTIPTSTAHTNNGKGKSGHGSGDTARPTTTTTATATTTDAPGKGGGSGKDKTSTGRGQGH